MSKHISKDGEKMMFSVFGKILTTILPASWGRYLIYISIALGMLGVGYTIYLQNQSLKEDLNQAAIQIQMQQVQIERIEAEKETIIADINFQRDLTYSLRMEADNIRQDVVKYNKKLEGYINREEVVIKKPSLVERRVNAASASVMQSWECETGSSCD